MSVRQPADQCAIDDAARDSPAALLDALGRPLRDLRISVTDRCNLRCTYCMPRKIFDENHAFLPRAELLSFEEIERLARLFVGLGVRKIRLTGGEPLLRRGIEQLVEKLARLQTAEGQPPEIALTTNGVLLARKARALKDAGLDRVTVSLDGLSDATVQHMSDSNLAVSTVLEGIDAAQAVGLGPVKINMVVKRNVNDHEIVPMAEHFRNTGIVLRFIEYMDVGCTNGWRMDDVVSAREMLDRVAARFPVEQIDQTSGGEVAERWRYRDGGGELGVIASVTRAFCSDCTRARLSTDGKLYNCLFAADGLDLRAPLRGGDGDGALSSLIAGNWGGRTDRYSELRQTGAAIPLHFTRKIEMSYIGG
jgi:cyclic pyranopterin phosphate synthase